MTELADSSTFTAAETWLTTSGRLLLRVAAMLFMAYLLTLVGTLIVSALGASLSSARSGPRSTAGGHAPRGRAQRPAMGATALAGPTGRSQARAPLRAD